MKSSEIEAIAQNPHPLLDTLRGARGMVFQRSNLFRRDLQYGLWRYLHHDQSRFPYHQMEQFTDDLIARWIEAGVVRQVGRQSYELLLDEYRTPSTIAVEPEKETSGEAPPSRQPVAGSSDDTERQARIAELQRKMAEAKARKSGDATDGS